MGRIDSPSFWTDQMELLFRLLSPLVTQAVLDGLEEMMWLDSAEGVLDWAIINDRAMTFASQYSFKLVKDITDTSRKVLQDTISSWVESGEGLSSLIGQLGKGDLYGPARGLLIAVSETTRAFAEGNLMVIQEAARHGFVKGQEWDTARDELVCPICGELDSIRVGVDENYPGGIKGPPAHPGCRCGIRPVVTNV
jgi:hypothetical protein